MSQAVELVVLNPTFIIGPALVTSLRSSLVAIKAIVEGTMPALPRQRFGVAWRSLRSRLLRKSVVLLALSGPLF
jgi:hypothetical protein